MFRRMLGKMVRNVHFAVDDDELTVRAVFVLHVQLAQTEIAQRNVTCVIEQNVLGLQITVNDIESVQALQCAKQLSGIESCAVDVESLLFLQVVEQLASVDKGQHKVQLLWRLEREFERYNEGVVDLGQNRSLGERMCDFGARDDVSLADGLQGVDSMCVLLPG